MCDHMCYRHLCSRMKSVRSCVGILSFGSALLTFCFLYGKFSATGAYISYNTFSYICSRCRPLRLLLTPNSYQMASSNTEVVRVLQCCTLPSPEAGCHLRMLQMLKNIWRCVFNSYPTIRGAYCIAWHEYRAYTSARLLLLPVFCVFVSQP